MATRSLSRLSLILVLTILAITACNLESSTGTPTELTPPPATQTPIVPLIFGDDMVTFGFWKKLFEQGVFTNPVISPAVPPDGSLIRTSYMATHTDKELDKVLGICQNVGKEMGLL